jgi:hypothetical protein
MERSVEEREPVADERRLDWIVENRSDRLARAFALEEEDDLGLRQEDGVPVHGRLELHAPEGRVFGEKLLRPLTTAWFQAGDEDEAIHGGKPTLPMEGFNTAMPRPARISTGVPCPSS